MLSRVGTVYLALGQQTGIGFSIRIPFIRKKHAGNTTCMQRAEGSSKKKKRHTVPARRYGVYAPVIILSDQSVKDGGCSTILQCIAIRNSY